MQQQWISVKDELPPGGEWYIILFEDGSVELNTRYRLSDKSATHWMPLSELPK